MIIEPSCPPSGIQTLTRHGPTNRGQARSTGRVTRGCPGVRARSGSVGPPRARPQRPPHVGPAFSRTGRQLLNGRRRSRSLGCRATVPTGWRGWRPRRFRPSRGSPPNDEVGGPQEARALPRCRAHGSLSYMAPPVRGDVAGSLRRETGRRRVDGQSRPSRTTTPPPGGERRHERATARRNDFRSPHSSGSSSGCLS